MSNTEIPRDQPIQVYDGDCRACGVEIERSIPRPPRWGNAMHTHHRCPHCGETTTLYADGFDHESARHTPDWVVDDPDVRFGVVDARAGCARPEEVET